MVVKLCPKLDRKLARHAEKIKSIQRHLFPMARPADYSVMVGTGRNGRKGSCARPESISKGFGDPRRARVVMEVDSTGLRHGMWWWVSGQKN